MKLLEQNFQVNEAKNFNSLPSKIRNITKVWLMKFKMTLDKFLKKVPDQPKIDGLTPGPQDNSNVYSNSLLYETKMGPMGEWRMEIDNKMVDHHF